MRLNINHYQGREQSFIKHLFLQKYLENAAYKLFQGRSPVFNFVDAFAGPWRNSDSESLSDTSFALALTTLENVRRILANLGHSNLRVRFRFCEKNPESLAKLQAFAESKTDFDIKVFSGAFEDNLAGIQAACRDVRDSFTFTFIDPTGWNVDSRPIFSFLKDLRGEVLFNFMSEHVNRHAGWDGVATSVGRFLADPAWRPAFEALPDVSNEEKVLRLFKAKMKEAGAATHLPDIVIRKPREDRIKMRLILGTHNSHGVSVFRDVQALVEKEAIRTRQNIKITESGQPSLFSEGQIIEFEAQRDGVGCAANMGWATETLLGLVRSQPGIAFESAAPLIMEQVPVRETHVKDIAVTQHKAGFLHFDLPPGKRKPQASTNLYPAASEAADDRPTSAL